jgi:predicted Zn-dependent protease
VRAGRGFGKGAAALAAIWLLASCSVVEQGTEILADTGQISAGDQKAIVSTSRAARSTFSEISGEEEHYIGRGVAALVLARYSVYRNDALTRYLNELGQSVAVFSDRPETYGGYHFAVLDSDEINALAAPGGLIFVTRGLVRRCANEEMLAAVLAHEVGHVSAKHGLQSIQKSRLIEAFEVIGQTAADRYGPEQLSRLTSLFEGALGDVVDTLIIRGYDRKYEYEADSLAMKTLAAAGFAAQGLPGFLGTLTAAGASEQGKGWFKTHPSAEQRLDRLKSAGATGAGGEVPDARTQRFKQNTKGV